MACACDLVACACDLVACACDLVACALSVFYISNGQLTVDTAGSSSSDACRCYRGTKT